MSYKKHFSRALEAHPGRLHFAAHSHHLWPDVTANVYHHASNQLATGNGGPYEYSLFFCCSANVHQGWPKFMFSAVLLDPSSASSSSSSSDTVVIGGYAPSSTTLTNGHTITISGS